MSGTDSKAEGARLPAAVPAGQVYLAEGNLHIASIGEQFALDGEFVEAQRYDGGHINETLFAAYRGNGGVRRYVHQRINTRVFADAHALTHNIAFVTRHMRATLQARGVTDIERRVLQVIPTAHGGDLLVTPQGYHWRTYAFIERTVPRPRVETPGDALWATKAFGEFTEVIANLPVSELHDTIPGFHDTPARLRALRAAVENDDGSRANDAAAEIAQAFSFGYLAPALLDLAQRHAIPLRATHNDTKITNVLFDAGSGDAVCVVDLDTVMPGLTLFDVGELIRTACTHAAEDETDVSRVVAEPGSSKPSLTDFLPAAATCCCPRSERISLRRAKCSRSRTACAS